MTKNLSPEQFNQPEQLKLFMTGVEWQEYTTHSSDGPADIKWKEASAQAKAPASAGTHGAGVYDSMKSKGYEVHNPVPTITFEESPNGKYFMRTQGEGHHRVAAAADIERETGKPVYIPTNYKDATPAARKRARDAAMKKQQDQKDQ